MSLPIATLELTDFAMIAMVGAALFTIASLGSRHGASLHRIGRKLDALLKQHGVEVSTGLSPEVLRLAIDPGQKIAAIKLHREQTGCSLAEAKVAVEKVTG